MTPEVKAAICARVAANESLDSILRDPGMPTLLQCKEDAEFVILYKNAKQEQYQSPSYVAALTAAFAAAVIA